MPRFTRAVLYARFSSDNQRTESIDAQMRAMNKYCKDNHFLIVNEYIDEAKSATTDKRPSFQQMIQDSEQKTFDVVIVHKLDRFARNRYDSAIYKKRLKQNNVKVYSVLENLNDSPESIMMEAMLEGMSEYYSKNLGREVIKGMTENALKGKHTGGKTPLGYDLDENKYLVINPKEAEAVKIIFDLFDKGFGYSYIISYLNERGYQTKRGNLFGKNSLYELLTNEKYTGAYIYNRSAKKGINETRNHHRNKPAEQIIRLENGCPAIISKEQFQRVKERMQINRKRAGSYHSKEFYLLSGKVRCGICGRKLIGDRRFSGAGKNRLVTYRCDAHRLVCKNKEINKDYLDAYVDELIGREVCNEQSLNKMKKSITQYISTFKKSGELQISKQQKKLAETEIAIRNLVQVIQRGIISEAVYDEIEKLTQEKNLIQQEINRLNQIPACDVDQQIRVAEIIGNYQSLKGQNAAYRNFLQQFIREVLIFPYHVELELKTGFGIADALDRKISIKKRAIYERFNAKLRKKEEVS